MGQAEPPSYRSRVSSHLFLMGRNSCGNWVVQDQQGRCGGLFVSRAEALRFARRENGNRPCAVVMVPGAFELDLSPRTFPRAATTSAAPLQRAA